MHDKQNTAPENWLRQRLTRQMSELLRLSFPIVLQRIGTMAMGLVDTLMVGHYSARDLAYQSAGDIPVITLIVLTIGLLTGIIVLSSNAVGADNPKEAGAIWQRGMLYALGLGLLWMAICMFGEEILLALGQDADISRGGGEVAKVLGYGMPFMTLLLACTFFLESISRPLPGLIVMIFANVLNIVLNWALVFGHLGFEPMGAVGSAWSTTIIRAFIFFGLLLFILTLKDGIRFGIRDKADLSWKCWRRQRHIGYAAGITNGAEHLGFAGLMVFAGWISAETLAATTITFKLFGLPFMIAIGLGGATSVRVGLALGRRDPADLMLAGSAGLGFNILTMLPLAVLMVVFAENLTLLFTTAEVLVALTTPLISLSGFLLVFDTSQAIMGNALRGRQDVWMPTIIYIFSFNMVMIPLSWYMAFALDRKAEGLIEAVILTSVLAFSLAAGRFYYLAYDDWRTAREKAPAG